MMRKSPFPNGPQALGLVLALIVGEMLIALMLAPIGAAIGVDAESTGVVAIVLANGLVLSQAIRAADLGGWGMLVHAGPSSARSTLLVLTLPVLALVPALVLAIAVAMDLLVELVPLSAWEEALFDDLASGSLPMLLLGCVLAPVLEEMLFRGVILRGFLRLYPRGQAMAGSAIVFGVAHLNLYQFLAATTLGLVLAWLYERTRSLIPCITLHAGYNVALLAWAAGTADGLWSDDTWAPGWAGFSAALLLAWIGGLCLRTVLGPQRRRLA